MVRFCENLIKQKLLGTPENGAMGQVRSDQVSDISQVSSDRSKFKGASAAMVPCPSQYKFGREMVIHVWAGYP